MIHIDNSTLVVGEGTIADFLSVVLAKMAGRSRQSATKFYVSGTNFLREVGISGETI